jgi:uncharacterized membrane protein YhaH (DUF805 family)
MVTKQQFDMVYDKHKPTRFTKFMFKHFSKHSERDKFQLGNVVSFILIALFIIGFIGTAFDGSDKIIGVTTMLFAVLLVCVVILMFIAIHLNNKRIKAISKELGISLSEYSSLVTLY